MEFITFLDNIIHFLNLLTLLTVLYFLLSVPYQTFSRFRKKSKGIPVTPMRTVIKKLFKYWVLTFAGVFIYSFIVAFIIFSLGGFTDDEFIAQVVGSAFVGNILSALCIAYALLSMSKKRWSHSHLHLTTKKRPKTRISIV